MPRPPAFSLWVSDPVCGSRFSGPAFGGAPTPGDYARTVARRPADTQALGRCTVGVRSASRSAVIAPVPPVNAAVLAPVVAFFHNRGGANDRSGSRDRCSDHAPPACTPAYGHLM